MSVVIERDGCDDCVVAVDPDGTVDDLKRAIHEHLALPCSVDAYEYTCSAAVGGVLPAGSVLLADAGVMCVDTRVTVALSATHVARAKLRALGVADDACDAAFIGVVKAALVSVGGAAIDGAVGGASIYDASAWGGMQAEDAIALFMQSRRGDREGDATSMGTGCHGSDGTAGELLGSAPALSQAAVATAMATAAAATADDASVLAHLLRCGGDARGRDGSGWSYLSFAVQRGSCAGVAALLECGAEPTAPMKVPVLQGGTHDVTPLMAAVTRNHPEITRLLLAHGFDATVDTPRGMTLLMHAASTNAVGCMEVLVEYGADVDAVGAGGLTALMLGAHSGDAACVEKLVDVGSDVHARTSVGVTCLMLGVASGSLRVVRVLAERGCDIHAKDNFGLTALHLASRDGHLGIVTYLLARGADPNVREEHRETPMVPAARYGHLPIVRCLVGAGGDVNARSDTGYTGLITAAGIGHIGVMRYLLDHGADVAARADDGFTALSLAEDSGFDEAAAFLKANGGGGWRCSVM